MAVWLLIGWLVPALVFLAFTYAEGASVGRRGWDLWRVAGLAGCVAWPVALPLLVIVFRRHSRLTAQAARARIADSMNDKIIILMVLVTCWMAAMPLAWAMKVF